LFFSDFLASFLGIILGHYSWASVLDIILIGGMPDRHREPDRNEEIMVMGAGTMGQI
jgi:hypothetical protein